MVCKKTYNTLLYQISMTRGGVSISSNLIESTWPRIGLKANSGVSFPRNNILINLRLSLSIAGTSSLNRISVTASWWNQGIICTWLRKRKNPLQQHGPNLPSAHLGLPATFCHSEVLNKQTTVFSTLKNGQLSCYTYFQLKFRLSKLVPFNRVIAAAMYLVDGKPSRDGY